MLIGVPRETDPNETRVACSPDSAARLVKLGATVQIEAGLGASCFWTDEEYEKVGAQVTPNREAILKESDIVLRVRQPDENEVPLLKEGALHISYLDPFNNRDIVEKLAAQKVRAVSMEMIPRSTIAQKMDALSSQHSLAGYYMVVKAAELLAKVFPMMTTPAGTIQPARVFIIGAGVAGLQAIATAKRMGARVDAFDTRSEVAEQVRSLGGRFLEIDLGETGSTAQGYAKALTDEQLAIQREAMAKQCAVSDIVITTAQLFGRKAPVVVTDEMLKQMRPGSIVVDYAVESGGNVEGSVAGEIVDLNGVSVVGIKNYPGQVPAAASTMYASNLAHYLNHFWDREEKIFKPAEDDEIYSGSLITKDGEIVNNVIKKHYEGA